MPERRLVKDRAQQRAPAYGAEGVRGDSDVDPVVKLETVGRLASDHPRERRDVSEVGPRIVQDDPRLVTIASKAHDQSLLTGAQLVPPLVEERRGMRRD